ncbi:hypothetical protein Moror_1854 [Moniliophthora roreri MCA 2997]|uniref:NAD(P)-binding protein n=2 Tax=Moniliophthora roreri TaxID=221103 RepID=V2X1M3_MONRO|nr:hypothetical protein Moror_1854 [Moniliophthora roreri MCA 2997]
MSSSDLEQPLAVHIPDEKLFGHSERVKDKVVVITGAGNGIGKETALKFASYGAKIVIGDRDVKGAEKTVEEIQNAGGQAISIKCDVTIYEDNVALYEHAMKTYGSVDVVIPNAGVGEMERYTAVQKDQNQIFVPPQYKTIQVNLIGVLNTLHLAQHYLLQKPGPLKAVVLIGSMASWQAIPVAPEYTATKHAILGVMRSLHPFYLQQGIRIAVVHPFFADTNILKPYVKLFLAGVPLTPVPRIAGAIFYASTEPSMETSGSAFLLPDDGPVFMIPKEEFKLGVYGMIDRRSNALLRTASGLRYYSRVAKTWIQIAGKSLLTLGLGLAAVSILSYRLLH